MLITHCQLRPNGGNNLHIQATGPAFPTSYASGNINVSEEAAKAVESRASAEQRGSLRPGSSARYCIGTVTKDGVSVAGVEVIGTADLVNGLNAPSPAYNDSESENVRTHVKQRLQEAATPIPVPTPPAGEEDSVTEVDVLELASKIAVAVNLNEAGEGKVAQVIREYFLAD